MKIHIHVEPDHQGVDVHIYTATYTDEIDALMQRIQQVHKSTIIGYLDDEIHLIRVEDVYSIYAEDAKVFIQTAEDEYRAKMKLYEIEEQYGHHLVRINKSTLIHIDHIQSLQLKVIGAAQVVLTNEVEIPISRNFIKSLKEKLGIGRG